ncbi:hypothetical protein [Quadrisphaera sp. INWT6]|uniref:hypothetical protein n=1 Tax=Quadrisphaera sp. INWT6 TaxID=2596917 RepID=UPI0035CD336E
MSAVMTPALRWPWAALVAVGGGLLLYLAFPGHDLWFLAPLGIGALVVATSGRRARPAAGLGLLHGLAFFAPLLSWSGIYLGPIAWVPLSLACALSVALAGVLLAWTGRLQLGGRVGVGWGAGGPRCCGRSPRPAPGRPSRRCWRAGPSAASAGAGWPSARPTPPPWAWPPSAGRRW